MKTLSEMSPPFASILWSESSFKGFVGAESRTRNSSKLIPYPGYSYKYSYAPYSQNILYGMPPHSGMLLRFLASPFPFGGHHRTAFIGPNKYHHFGGWGGHKYYSSAWGPVW
ncbi:hypothetical protein COOONC_21323 [Cooperia oncophora]